MFPIKETSKFSRGFNNVAHNVPAFKLVNVLTAAGTGVE